MAASTSWSNQLTRLFNGPLDRESVFGNHDELTAYLVRDEICYSGQIVAVLDDDYRGGQLAATGVANTLRIYALKEVSGILPLPENAIHGNNGGEWELTLLASADATIANAAEADKLTTSRNIKVKDIENNIDGSTGVNFDGSADIQIPVKLVDRDAIDALNQANGGNAEFVMVKVNKQGIVIDGAITIGQEKIEFGMPDGNGGRTDNTFDDLKIVDDIDNLANVTISGSLADKDILQYDAEKKEWVNKTLSDAGVADDDHTHKYEDLTDVDVTGLGTSDDDAKYPQDKTIMLYDIAAKKWKPTTLRGADIFSKTEHVVASPGYFVIDEDPTDPANPSYYQGQPIILNQYGKIDQSLLPPMSLTTVYQSATLDDMVKYHKVHNVPVASGTVMIVEDTVGADVNNGTDVDGKPIHVKVPKTYMYAGAPAIGSSPNDTELVDWIELSQTGTVVSVNGKQGTVTLGALDVYGVPLINNDKNGAVTPDNYVRVNVDKYGLVKSGETTLDQKYMIFNANNKLSDLGIVDILDSLNDVQIGQKPVMVDDGTGTGNLIQATNDEGEPIFTGQDVSDKDILAYDAQLSQWVNKTLSQLDAKAVLESDITVQQGVGGTVGGVKTGDLLQKGMTLQKVLEKILIKQINYTYTKPTITFNISTAEGELGTTISNFTSTTTYTDAKGDAGAVTNLAVTYNAIQVLSSTSMTSGVPVICNEPYTVNTPGNVTMKAVINYGTGPIKNDNLGDPCPTGQIQAGTLTATKNFFGYRKTFVQSGASGVVPTTSAEIRAFATSFRADNKKSFNINVNVGDKFFCIASPYTLKSVIAVNQSNAEIVGNFVLSSVDVEGANGFTAQTYKVYTYIPNAPFGNTDILKVTLQ